MLPKQLLAVAYVQAALHTMLPQGQQLTAHLLAGQHWDPLASGGRRAPRWRLRLRRDRRRVAAAAARAPLPAAAACAGCCAAARRQRDARAAARAAGVWRSRMMRKATYPASVLSTTTASATGSRLLSRPPGTATAGAWSAGGAKHAVVLAIRASAHARCRRVRHRWRTQQCKHRRIAGKQL